MRLLNTAFGRLLGWAVKRPASGGGGSSIDYVITLPDGTVVRRTASGYTRTSPGGVVFTDRPLSQ